MESEILEYNERQDANHKKVCGVVAKEIDGNLPGAESKIWHSHHVWFLDVNPTVGCSKQKNFIRLIFWSEADFEELGLDVLGLLAPPACAAEEPVLSPERDRFTPVDSQKKEGGAPGASLP